MRTIERDGVRLAYVEAGAGEPAVLLLHGMACRHEHMLPVLTHLADRHRCVAIDLRGHGSSDAPVGAYTMDDFLADVDGVVGSLDLGRPILIGHSFGGSIALAYADRYPDRVAALVMLDSGMRSNQVLTADLGPFYDELRSGDAERYRATLGAFVRERLVDPVDGEAFAAEIAALMGTVPSHVFLSMSETVQQLRSAELAARCALPSLLVLSRQDFADPAAVAALGPNWHVGRVVGAGHFVQVVAPAQVNAMLDRFLELTLPPPASGGPA
ncbi:MAG TPA: alpha/beta hydrolase [Acidimicrobiia bacterium]|nr:alpha/beta hydrolase [Acidimicrobiia bacterium]